LERARRLPSFDFLNLRRISSAPAATLGARLTSVVV
jgi:hypothetical protein